MSTQEHKLCVGRRLEVPEWATNDRLLRQVLIAYLESRAGFRKPKPGTDKERMQHALAELAATRPARARVLSGLCKQYVATKNQNADPIQLRKLAAEIENIDTALRTEAHFAAIVVGMVHAFYRRGLSSVEVGAELKIKPPHVRQTLWRLRRCWDRLQGIRRPSNPERKRGQKVAERMLAQYRKGKTIRQIAKWFGVPSTKVFRKLSGLPDYKPRPQCPNPISGVTWNPEEVKRLYLAGTTVYKIALALGYPRGHGQNRIRCFLIREGLYHPAA